MIRNKRYPRGGFTLIELLVAVLIIGILAAIALPQYQEVVDKANYSSMMSLVKAIKNEQELYYMVHGRYAANFEELGTDLLPDNFTLSEDKVTASFPKYTVEVPVSLYVAGELSKPNMAYFLGLDNNHDRGEIQCWTYGNENERKRANKVCKNLARDTTPVRVENGYEIYSLK